MEFEQLNIKAAHAMLEKSICNVLATLISSCSKRQSLSQEVRTVPSQMGKKFSERWEKMHFCEHKTPLSLKLQAWICIQISPGYRNLFSFHFYIRGKKLILHSLSQRRVQETVCPLMFTGNVET